MEFDNLITYILLFAFFVLPSILKARGKKKKPRGVKKKSPSVLGKLRERIQDFVRELEKQAAATKQANGQDQTVWDELADPEAEPVLMEEVASQDPAPMPEFYDADHPFIIPGEKRGRTPEPEPARVEGRSLVPEVRADLPAHSLQQAVIWSEILGKPVALR